MTHDAVVTENITASYQHLHSVRHHGGMADEKPLTFRELNLETLLSAAQEKGHTFDDLFSTVFYGARDNPLRIPLAFRADSRLTASIPTQYTFVECVPSAGKHIGGTLEVQITAYQAPPREERFDWNTPIGGSSNQTYGIAYSFTWKGDLATGAQKIASMRAVIEEQCDAFVNKRFALEAMEFTRRHPELAQELAGSSQPSPGAELSKG